MFDCCLSDDNLKIVIRIQTVITSMLYILCLARFILISVELIK